MLVIRGATEAPAMGRKCTAAELNYQAFAKGCQVKKVYMLPDVSVRFKGLFVAVPQIAIKCPIPLGDPATPIKTIARRLRAIASDQETHP